MLSYLLMTLAFAADGIQKNPRIHYENGKEIKDSEVSFYRNEKKHGFTLILNSQGDLLSLEDCEIDGERRVPEDCRTVYLPGYEALQKKHFAAEQQEKEKDLNRTVKDKNGEYQLKNGKIEGLEKKFFPSGKVRTEKNYKAGVLDGFSTEYFEEGQVKSKIEYKNGKQQKGTFFFQNGKVESEWSREKTEELRALISYSEFDDRGRLREQGKAWLETDLRGWDVGRREGEIKFYREGELQHIRHYREGKPDGTWTEFLRDKNQKREYKVDEKGRTLEETVFDLKTEKKQVYRQFMPDGSLKKEEKF